MRGALRIIAGFATVIFVSSSAFGACFNAKAVCSMVVKCVEDATPTRDNDRQRIRDGVSSRDGHLVWLGLDACMVDMQLKRDMDRDSGGCSNPEFVNAAEAALAGNCASFSGQTEWECSGYEAGKLVVRGSLPPYGSCSAPAGAGDGNLCQCGVFQGQLHKKAR